LSLGKLALSLFLRVFDRVLISDDDPVLLFERVQGLFGFLFFFAHPLNHFLLLSILEHSCLQLIAQLLLKHSHLRLSWGRLDLFELLLSFLVLSGCLTELLFELSLSRTLLGLNVSDLCLQAIDPLLSLLLLCDGRLLLTKQLALTAGKLLAYSPDLCLECLSFVLSHLQFFL